LSYYTQQYNLIQSIPQILQHGEGLYYEVTLANLTSIHGKAKDISYRFHPSLTPYLEVPRNHDNQIRLEITACNHNGCVEGNRSFISIPAISHWSTGKIQYNY